MQLLRTILGRCLTTAITLAGVAVIVFVTIRVVPGNPIAMMLPPGATEADVTATYADGVLEIRVPIAEAVAPAPTKIPITRT